MSSSTTTSSTSFGKRTPGHPLCFCEIEAPMRYSNTKKNPGRAFLSCAKYNKEEISYYKYFKWVEDDEYMALDREETHNEVLSKEKELKKLINDFENIIIELRRRADEINLVLSNRNEELLKELVAVVREAEIRRSRTLLCVFWTFAFVVAYYLIVHR
ncbi:hypothetical protein I3843_08G012700 [Carya illinoinensis]|nr:hypothetical protein I3843_08G012700 [Carya illinoinensis]